MLTWGDCDLNSAQRYVDSLKEVIKQTILKQEVAFRMQVDELHRLYTVQKSLMNDLGFKDCGRYSLWNTKAQSLLPAMNPSRYDQQEKEIRIPTITCSRNQQRPFDLQLSADEYINHVEEDLPKRRDVWNHLKEPIDFMHSLSGGNSSGSQVLKLSLSIGEDDRRMGGATKTWFDKIAPSCFPDVIDLEESFERISDRHGKCTDDVGCATPETYCKGNDELELCVCSNPIMLKSLMEYPSHDTAESGSVQEYSEFCPLQTSCNEGTRQCHNAIPCEDPSTSMQQFSSYQEGHLDLNKMQLDDSSCYSSDAAHPSNAISSGGFGAHSKKEVNNCPNGALPPDVAINVDLVDLNHENKSRDIWNKNSKNNEVSESNCIVSISRLPLSTSEYLGSDRDDQKNEDAELKLKLANGLLHDPSLMSVATTQVSCEKSEVEDVVFSYTDQSQNGQGDKSPASSKSCISDYGSTSEKRSCSGIIQYPMTGLGSEVAGVLVGEHDLRTSDGSEIKNVSYNKKHKSVNVDVLTLTAAESLIHISLETLVSYQDSNPKGKLKDTENEKREQLQNSCDSFELFTLTLAESNADDNSVSSKPAEVNDIDLRTKDFGLKLRRGRRMKDFQKEILPGLASLSRHEICEDINIMESVLRSREYRKMNAKMAAHEEKRSAPVRKSRRSKLNYGQK